MIYFRTRKYGDVQNGSFFLRYDDQPGDSDRAMQRMQKGDGVRILLDVTREQADAINDWRHQGLKASNSHVIDGDDWSVHLPLVVADKSHGLAPARGKYGTLNVLGTSVYLEATSGFWEDVMLWLLFGERPDWAPAEEEAAEPTAPE